MHSFTDQIGNNIQVPFPPKRIVSLVPSQTELLYSLQLDEEVVGITKFCIHPKSWFKGKQRVGGTKTINIAAVKALQPDLIIGNKEENVKEQIEALQGIAPVWVSDITTLGDTLEMIQSVGELVNKTERASKIASDIKLGFQQISPLKIKLRTAYMIWKNPFMVAAGDTFINDVMMYCGLDNVFMERKRYPETTIDELSSLGCQLILLSSEPYPFKEKHVTELQQQLPDAKIVLTDGEMFSWYGSRLLHTPGYLAGMIAQLQKQR
ncbi:helical backbone metal receptor [Segetibacter sp.]|uniref:ABC transporter substrate-binding protein n=1 Tax=Segetibacter sp. TaxID=2231182 RepID=UPI00262024A7|nr:helical backbone metal receptor [Segetibacter sp.]MCW3081509.1 iron transporter [Segetibacter sp.]